MKAGIGVTLAIALIAGCKSDKITGPDQNQGSNQNNPAQINQYLDSLPTWAEFSPLLPNKDPASTGNPTVSYDTVASVTTIDSAGNTSTSTNVPYVCETTRYSMQQTPQQIVMYSPDARILYPGAFIQGKSYKSGIGSLLALDITKRAPIEVSIPDFSFTDNYRTVDTVDEAHIESAVGSIRDEATTKNVQAPSSVAFEMHSYYSQSQLALSMSASGHYLGFSASASGSINTDASQHTVVAQFYEKMFTVVVTLPATTTTTGPAAWFRSDFTRAELQQQVSAGNIGPDNLPVYIGDIVYGRMMMFSLTSTASASDIQAALNASYHGWVGGGSVSLSAEQQKILQTATISVATMGGSDKDALAAIRSGNYTDYFTSSPPLSTAQPLSYDFYSLADGTLAQVTEATDYNVTTCSPVKPGQFDFLPAQPFAAPVATPFETRLVDVSGDGHADLVFNHRDASSNQVAVALAQADGSFAAPGPAVSDPATPSGGWANYQLATGDFNGDGHADLVWNELDSLNDSYVALANGSGGWTFEPLLQATPRGWTGYGLYVGDVATRPDGTPKDCDDLIWNQTSTGNNMYAVAVSNCDGTFMPPDTQRNMGTGGWTSWTTWVADWNRDGLADLAFNNVANGSYTWTEVATANGDSLGTMTLRGTQNQYSGDGGWWGYHRLVADFTGDQVSDLLFYRDPKNLASQAYILSGMQTMWPVVSLANVFSHGEYVTPVAGDVNGDGIADLILDNVTNTNNTVAVVIGTGNAGGSLTVPAHPTQIYPVSTSWTTATLPMTGDVNGDHDADVVWVIPGSTTRVFVALSRGAAAGS